MRRIVGSTLAVETQSLLNGIGHAEWIAAHFVEARFPNFDVAQRSTFLRNFRLPGVVDAKSLHDHLVSLSSPSSVEDKRCGFEFVFSRHCMQRLGATTRWAPTYRQLADAMTKDAADPVDLLRSCMRLGEYQLSPEHTIHERQQNDPGVNNDKHPLNLRHYRVSRPSHQMLSWFNHESV